MNRISTKSSGLATPALESVSARDSKIFLIPSKVGYCFGGSLSSTLTKSYTFFEDVFVLGAEIFRQHLFCRLAIGLDAVDGFDLRFDIPSDDVGVFPDKLAGRSYGVALVRLTCGCESVEAPFLSHDGLDRAEHGCLNLSCLQRAEALRDVADLDDCDILQWIQSDFF